MAAPAGRVSHQLLLLAESGQLSVAKTVISRSADWSTVGIGDIGNPSTTGLTLRS